jgi:hypothetical protein
MYRGKKSKPDKKRKAEEVNQVSNDVSEKITEVENDAKVKENANCTVDESATTIVGTPASKRIRKRNKAKKAQEKTTEQTSSDKAEKVTEEAVSEKAEKTAEETISEKMTKGAVSDKVIESEAGGQRCEGQPAVTTASEPQSVATTETDLEVTYFHFRSSSQHFFKWKSQKMVIEPSLAEALTAVLKKVWCNFWEIYLAD